MTRIAARLAVAFTTVAVIAVAVLSALIVVVADRETASLARTEHRDDARAASAAAALAYTDAGSWEGADLTTASAVAARAHADLVIENRVGSVVAAPTERLAEMMAEMHDVTPVDGPRGHAVTEPVVVDGQHAGSVTLTFPVSDTPATHVRDVLWRTVVVGASIAAAVALAAAVLVSNRVTRPVIALTNASSRLAAGDHTARAHVEGPGELGTLAATFDDMAERLDVADRARRQLVSDVAHELRTPLAILQGETEALLDGVTAPTDDGLRSLHDEVVRLARLVDDLETLAAADAARLTIHSRPIDISDVAAQAAASVRIAAEARRVALVEHLDAAPAAGDPDRLHQVVLNLLTNAIKFTPEGGTVTISTSRTNGHAVVTVADTGPGFAADEAAHVFDRFFQGAAGRASAAGSGIGLAVAAGIVDAHHGSLTAGNNPTGPGAVVRVELPA